MRLFLDANVLFAAAYSPCGRSAQIVSSAKLRSHDLLTSPHALTEAVPRLDEAMSGVDIVPEADPDAVKAGLEFGLPPKDAPILGAALREKADLLVTGDGKHFGHLYEKLINGMRTVPPAVALAELLELEK